MADNYLEKKYEELRQGKPVVRRNTPSLDTLLRRAGECSDIDCTYVVKQAQLDAVVRSSGLLGMPFIYESSETSADSPALVRISGQVSAFELGQAVLAVRLKAAELGLDSATGPIVPSEDGPLTLGAEVYIYRKRLNG